VKRASSGRSGQTNRGLLLAAPSAMRGNLGLLDSLGDSQPLPYNSLSKSDPRRGKAQNRCFRGTPSPRSDQIPLPAQPSRLSPTQTTLPRPKPAKPGPTVRNGAEPDPAQFPIPKEPHPTRPTLKPEQQKSIHPTAASKNPCAETMPSPLPTSCLPPSRRQSGPDRAETIELPGRTHCWVWVWIAQWSSWSRLSRPRSATAVTAPLRFWAQQLGHAPAAVSGVAPVPNTRRSRPSLKMQTNPPPGGSAVARIPPAGAMRPWPNPSASGAACGGARGWTSTRPASPGPRLLAGLGGWRRRTDWMLMKARARPGPWSSSRGRPRPGSSWIARPPAPKRKLIGLSRTHHRPGAQASAGPRPAYCWDRLTKHDQPCFTGLRPGPQSGDTTAPASSAATSIAKG